MFIFHICSLYQRYPLTRLYIFYISLPPSTHLSLASIPDCRLLPGDCTGVLDLAIVLDSSGSINEADGGNWNRILGFIQDVARRFPISRTAVQIAVVKYSNNANVEWNLNTYNNVNDLVNAMGAISYIGGTTNTADGLEDMNDIIFQTHNGDRSNAPNVAIVITDGQANERERDTIPEATRAKNRGIRIIAVGVTNAVDLTELRGIASTNADVIEVDDFSLLMSFLDQLTANVCPTPTPAPTTAPRMYQPSNHQPTSLPSLDIASIIIHSRFLPDHSLKYQCFIYTGFHSPSPILSPRPYTSQLLPRIPLKTTSSFTSCFSQPYRLFSICI